jgi:hypothetical protein
LWHPDNPDVARHRGCLFAAPPSAMIEDVIPYGDFIGAPRRCQADLRFSRMQPALHFAARQPYPGLYDGQHTRALWQ